MKLTVNTPDELIAAIPHILGFYPEESIVIVPMATDGGLPCARTNLAVSAAGRDEVLRVVRDAYRRNARPGAELALVCITSNRDAAEVASQHLAAGLLEASIGTGLRLWSDGERWEDLGTGAGGSHTQATADCIAATTVLAGARQPALSRDAMAASFVGDRTPISDLLPQTRCEADTSNSSRERVWALGRLMRFHRDGNRLTDSDGARLLVALECVPTRDALWEDMTRDNARSHSALWTDLTQRAPDEVRAAPAALAAFSLWLAGDGARAWCALEQVPQPETHLLASIVAASLQHGLHPDEWHRAVAELRHFEDELLAGADESRASDAATRHRVREPPPMVVARLGHRGVHTATVVQDDERESGLGRPWVEDGRSFDHPPPVARMT